MKKVARLILLFGIFGCKINQKKDFVFDEFKSQVESRGMKIEFVDKTGLIHVSQGELTMKISLDNVRKDYERYKDKTIISNFTQTILLPIELPEEWSDAKDDIYISLFTNNFEFEDIIYKKITEDFSKIYVYVERGQRKWISKDDITKWGISEFELDTQANNNADKLLNHIQIQYYSIENRKLGVIDVARTSALLFAPAMKEKVKVDIGFPFFAVIPVIDLCYVFSEQDFDFLAERIGKIVVDEYSQSGYPITTEILKFTDNGVEVEGKFKLINDE